MERGIEPSEVRKIGKNREPQRNQIAEKEINKSPDSERGKLGGKEKGEALNKTSRQRAGARDTRDAMKQATRSRKRHRLNGGRIKLEWKRGEK